MSQVAEITAEQFDAEVMQSSSPVLVDFYAPWCGPCKMLAPMLDGLAGEFDGKVKFVKVNVDDAQALAGKYQITGVPTLMFFQNGEVADTLVGMASPAALKSKLEAMAGSSA
jgi:thioredoxin 1